MAAGPLTPIYQGLIGSASGFDAGGGLTGPTIDVVTTADIKKFNPFRLDNEMLVVVLCMGPNNNPGAAPAGTIHDDAPGGISNYSRDTMPGDPYVFGYGFPAPSGDVGLACEGSVPVDEFLTWANGISTIAFMGVSNGPSGIPAGTTISIDISAPSGFRWYEVRVLKFSPAGGSFCNPAMVSRGITGSVIGNENWPYLPFHAIPVFPGLSFEDSPMSFVAVTLASGGVSNVTDDGYDSVVGATDTFSDESGLWTPIDGGALDGVEDGSAGSAWQIWERDGDGTEVGQPWPSFVESTYPDTNDPSAAELVAIFTLLGNQTLVVPTFNRVFPI